MLNHNTQAIHAGQESKNGRHLPSPNLWLNSAVLLNSVEEGWEMLTNESIANIAYQRYSNPTTAVLEQKFSHIEGAKRSIAVNSGMAACYIVFRALLKSGDHIISQHALYHEISDQLKFDKLGCNVDYTLLDDYSIDAFRSAMRPETRMVFIESPTNPVMLDVDIPSLAELCRKRGVVLVVDNTFLTPYYQRPLDLGAHVTLYSTTKSINGHGDAMGGLISTNDDEIYPKLLELTQNVGLILDPFSAWLTVRGLRTLPLRLDRHSENARKVVEFFRESYPNVPVITPSTQPNAKKNGLLGSGGVLSIVLKDKSAGTRFLRSIRLFRIGTTFGNLESLAYHFGTFTRPHRNLDLIGLPYGLVRLSIGLEDPADIIADLDQAMKVAQV